MERPLSTRGREFVGTVINAKMTQTATVEWPRQEYVSKYERFLTKRTRVKAHNPTAVDAKVGDRVRIRECRPISKTKSFIIIEKLGVDFAYLAREGDLKEGLTARGEEKTSEEEDAT